MPTYNVTVTYSTTVEIDLDEDGTEDTYAIQYDVLDEIASNVGNYLWDIEKAEDA
jgi:hypothetical protein